uniref:Uncharacterized protein n=1 Tax=viral metagenome TaxID=1070528 RepID=A0A6C0ADE3_9ZZZZ
MMTLEEFNTILNIIDCYTEFLYSCKTDICRENAYHSYLGSEEQYVKYILKYNKALTKINSEECNSLKDIITVLNNRFNGENGISSLERSKIFLEKQIAISALL